MSDVEKLKAKRDKLKRINKLKEELPHLYSFQFYEWQERFWNSTDTFQFTFKANQIGGSSVYIRKLIHYATEPKLWGLFARTPTMALFLQPDKNTLTREWENKWSEFLPKGEMKDHPQYGWKEEWEGNKYIQSVTFNTGFTIYFKTYGSGGDHVQTLQSSSPAILCCDEELPEELWPELQMRLASPVNKGSMFWMNATPTRGQKLWQDVQAGIVKLPNSLVQTISMYDCLKYANGDKSLWSLEHIKRIEQALPTEREIQVRVYGLFRAIEGLAITQFNSARHVKPFHIIKGWNYYAGIDYGVGGAHGHPTSIVIIAVNETYTSVRVLKCKRYDKTPTTPDDAIAKYYELLGELGLDECSVYFDHSCGSIAIISERQGLGFHKANKDRAYGFGLINSLFKNDMMIILDDDSGEPAKLISELESLRVDFNKKRAGDDLVDGLRYALASIPFNFENIKTPAIEEQKTTQKQVGRHVQDIDYDFDEVGDEIDEWNSSYG